MSVSVSVIDAHDECERKALAHALMSAQERELYTPILYSYTLYSKLYLFDKEIFSYSY